MFEDVPSGAWYIVAVGVVVCLLLISFSVISVDQQKAGILDEACRDCAAKLKACAAIVNGYSDGEALVVDFNTVQAPA